MAAEQLERSILERKERDELHAIASAMSLKPTARSKKADIIDLILRATGVGTDGATGAAGAEPNGSRAAGEERAAAVANGTRGEGAPVDGGATPEPAAASGGTAGSGAPRTRSARNPRRAVAAAQLELGGELALGAEHANGAADSNGRDGNGATVTVPRPESGSNERSSDEATGLNGAGSNGAQVNGTARAGSASPSASAEAGPEGAVAAPPAPHGAPNGSDLGNRRGRRRRGPRPRAPRLHRRSRVARLAGRARPGAGTARPA